MKSKNFEFLRDRWPELSSLGGFAEQYVWPDPPGALVKLRSFVESMVHRFYDEHGIPKPASDSLIELLNAVAFRQSVPPVVLNALHSIRLAGNKAAHGESVSRFNAPDLLEEAFHLGCWFFIINGGLQSDCPAYHAPAKMDRLEKTPEELKRDKQHIQKALAAKESEMQSLLTELEAARVKTRVTEKKVEELQRLLSIGKTAADALGFDEAATRKRLIDTELTAVGWDVGVNGVSTGEVTQEEEIQHQPTKTGIGYADYVLWDDNGQPLAVIEAKKTAVSAELGQEQAKLYADGLETVHGRRPVIFYTNGFDIFIWDDGCGYPPRKIYGFYSKDSLQYLIYKRENRLSLVTISAKPEIVDRIYQFEAIKRLTEKFTASHRKGLLVQATGTGKTRVAIALTDLLCFVNLDWRHQLPFCKELINFADELQSGVLLV